jgi:hypothetical protein
MVTAVETACTRGRDLVLKGRDCVCLDEATGTKHQGASTGVACAI